MFDYDFKVDYDPDKDDMKTLTEKIIYDVVIRRRLKAKKPTVIFTSGDSGEGKSMTALSLQYLLLKMQGLDLRQYLEPVNVFNPLEYATKIDKILMSKQLKDINIICVHEARELVKAKNWHSFLSQAIADINAMSRSIKRLVVIILSQFIRDITSDVRYTITYYLKVKRSYNQRARVEWWVLWKDDRDLEKPKLRKRKLKGYLVYPNGKRRLFIPSYFSFGLVPADIVAAFDKADYEAKAKIIRRKTEQLIKAMEQEAGLENIRVKQMAEWLLDPRHSLELSAIGKRYRGGWKLRKEALSMFNINEAEAKELEKILAEKMKTQAGRFRPGAEADITEDEMEGEMTDEQKAD